MLILVYYVAIDELLSISSAIFKSIFNGCQ